MSLLSQKKENDRVAAEAAAKAKEEAVLRDLAVHPVIKMGCSRAVRDAYLYGIVVAAIANDDKIDAEERGILDRIANSMEIPDADVEETIGHVNQMSVDEKLQLLEESVGAFKDQADLVKFFYAQFAELWLTGEHNLGELKEIAGMLEGWSGVEFPTGRFKEIKAVVSNNAGLNAALDDLTAWLGDDMVMRFAVSRYGNVSSRIEQSRKERRDKAEAARRKAAEAKRLAAAREAAEKQRAEEKRRKEAEKVSGFFDTVASVVEGMGIFNDIRTNESTLAELRAKLIAKGLGSIDQVKVYQAIHDAFVTKVDRVSGKRTLYKADGEPVRLSVRG